MVFLDTHVAVWIYAGEEERLSSSCVSLLEENDLFISPMVVLELQYLHEIEKIKISSSKILQVLKRDLNLQICNCPFETIVMMAAKEQWTRDPFDRIIVSHAKVKDSALLSKDQRVRDNYREALW